MNSDDRQILVVDDNMVDRQAIVRLVGDRYAIVEAATAEEGLRLSRSVEPECVLLDYRLPDGDGLALVEQFAEHQAAVIMLTGQGNENTAVEAMKRGAQDYLIKEGLTRDVLRRAIEYAMERRDLEKQVMAGQRMEAVGRLAGGIAHDFNNVLTVVVSHASFLRAQVGDDAVAQADVHAILEAVDRAARLTSQLLAFSRRQPRQLRVASINHIVEDLDGMLRSLVGVDIELRVELGAELGLVRTDISQMEQILMNLAVNGRDAMPDGGTLTVETANVDLADDDAPVKGAALPPGAYVRLAVTDTGTGMDERTKEHVFEPFFTTKEPGKGTGLGLSTVYGIVRQNRGGIRVESEPGQGAAFHVYLPRVEAAITEPDHALETESVGGSETVLLVEDDGIVRAATTRILRSAGYEVLEAAESADALSLAEHHDGPIHVVLTDMVMPGLSGREIAAQVAALRPASRAVFMSGYDDTGADSLPEGSQYLPKPFTPENLLDMLRRALEP